MEEARSGIPDIGLRCSPVAGLPVRVADIGTATASIVDGVGASGGRYAVLFNTHMCSEAHRDPRLRSAVESARWVFADGRPVYWLQRLAGAKTAGHVRGADLTWAALGAAERAGLRVGFFGASEPVLARLRQRLAQRFPALDVVLMLSPAFGQWSAEQNASYLRRIEAARPALLFVALGCPRQELWMAAHAEALDCVMLGVGAAVDFCAGVKPQAPRWMQRLGLEWLYRLLSEPRRLWRRYLFHNLHFLALLVFPPLRRAGG